ncbi:MAG: hypothetical protein GSR85_08490 [Desulfurococcales archaeon]|nr:hypothetical protein [Desulfurococcales archaeon]
MGYRRYRRSTGASRLARGGRAYLRPYMRLEEGITSVDAVEFPNLDKALKRMARLRGKYKGSRGALERLSREYMKFMQGTFGDLKLIAKPKVGGRTVGVHHIIVDRQGRIVHYGIKGLRDWSGAEGSDINFYTRDGYVAEYDIVRDKPLKKSGRRRKH